MFPMTATQTTTVSLPLVALTPTTPDWTGISFSRVRGISKSKKSKSSRSQSKQLPNEFLLLRARNCKKREIEKKDFDRPQNWFLPIGNFLTGKRSQDSEKKCSNWASKSQKMKNSKNMKNEEQPFRLLLLALSHHSILTHHISTIPALHGLVCFLKMRGGLRSPLSHKCQATDKPNQSCVTLQIAVLKFPRHDTQTLWRVT